MLSSHFEGRRGLGEGGPCWKGDQPSISSFRPRHHVFQCDSGLWRPHMPKSNRLWRKWPEVGSQLGRRPEGRTFFVQQSNHFQSILIEIQPSWQGGGRPKGTSISTYSVAYGTSKRQEDRRLFYVFTTDASSVSLLRKNLDCVVRALLDPSVQLREKTSISVFLVSQKYLFYATPGGFLARGELFRSRWETMEDGRPSPVHKVQVQTDLSIFTQLQPNKSLPQQRRRHNFAGRNPEPTSYKQRFAGKGFKRQLQRNDNRHCLSYRDYRSLLSLFYFV